MPIWSQWHRTTPRAYRTPTLTVASPQGKKRKQVFGETSLLRKPLKVTIRQKKQSTTLILPPGDDIESDEMAEATLISLTLYKTALATKAQENIAKVKEKPEDEEIEKMVEGEEDEESYASKFTDSMFNDDDDSGTRIEPGSHKENLEVVVDDYVIKKKDDKKDENEEKYDDVEKIDDVVEEKDNDDHTNHKLVRTHATGIMETRNEQMQTPISTLNRPPRKDLSLDKTISEEFTETVSPITATTSKSKCKRGFTSNKTKILPGSIADMFLDHCNNVVPELTFAKTNEMIKEEMPRLDADPPKWGETGEKIKINLTAPTLIFPGIEKHDPYSIVDKPDTSLIYLNKKNEMRVMYLVEIVKFYDVTLEKVLKEVKLKIFQTEFWKKPPLLGELDLDILKVYEREIIKSLRHREQMRR
ncbi:hypothetical protein Tco_1115443 [Tanacetum coccineum]